MDDTYHRLARPWPRDLLAAHYRAAERDGLQLTQSAHADPSGPVGVAAAAIPLSASASVAIHLVHALPQSAGVDLAEQLLETAERHTAGAIARCRDAIRLDAEAHCYTAEEWQPIIFDITASLLESARLNDEPPTIVKHLQDAISWLSRAVVELHEDSSEAPTALAETLARLLAVWVFADAALTSPEPA